ncbi:VOC family protein [Actinomadura terrae]|uniref:VOC family protein n=1 Tax=Actinomadura terrae TaxID=604353 RepID=UPI001FA775DF|nr:VOC family protein [Actinomadura terrae]
MTDLARARAFYEALGWRGQEVEETVFFQAGCIGISLWDRGKLARDCGLEPTPVAGFEGIVLAHNVRSDAEVDAVLAAAGESGGTVTKAGVRSPLGFYTGAFTDPDGHAWEVAHNPSFPLAEDGSVTIPDFSDM